jgi:ketosteroid isomerase-like protein
MSQENVEICKRIVELLGGLGSTAGVEAALEYVDAQIVFESAIVSGAEGNAYRGHDGLRAWVADQDAAFEELRTVAEEFRDLDDRVLMLGHVVGRGRGSGMVVESPIAFLTTFSGGRVVRAKGFLDWVRPSKPPGCGSRRRTFFRGRCRLTVPLRAPKRWGFKW